MKEKKWFVYLLECSDGLFYTGVTNNLDKRMKAHSEGKGSRYVHKKGFSRLLRAISCKSKSIACKYECEIKQLPKNEKLIWFDE